MLIFGYIVCTALMLGVVGFSIAFCVCAERLMDEEAKKA